MTDTRRWVVTRDARLRPARRRAAEGREAGRRATSRSASLTDEAPVYDRPRKRRAAARADVRGARVDRSRARDLLALLGSPNIGSRAWIWRQYDHIVRGGTVVRPGSRRRRRARALRARRQDVVEKHLAFAVDCNGRFVRARRRTRARRWRSPRCAATSCARAPSRSASPIASTSRAPRTRDDGRVRARDRRPRRGVPRARRADRERQRQPLQRDDRRAGGIRSSRRPASPRSASSRDEKDILTQSFRREGDVVVLLGDGDVADAGRRARRQRVPGARRRVASADRRRASISRPSGSSSASCSSSRARTSSSSAHDVSDGGLAVALAECCTTAQDGTLVGAARHAPGGRRAARTADGRGAVRRGAEPSHRRPTPKDRRRRRDEARPRGAGCRPGSSDTPRRHRRRGDAAHRACSRATATRGQRACASLRVARGIVPRRGSSATG